MKTTRAILAASALLTVAAGARAQAFDISWYTIDGGGGTSSGGTFTLTATIGQPDAGVLSGGVFQIGGGFWSGFTGQACYANCDGSSASPILTVNDFICFQSRFAAADSYANCDGSTASPTLTVNDFICFQSRFAAGCP